MSRLYNDKKESASKKNMPKSIKEIICYKCNEKGHISRNCPEHNPINTITENENTVKKTDIRRIVIEGKECDAVFDTGAAASMITRKSLQGLKVGKPFKINKVFYGLDGRELKTKEAIKICFMYLDKVFHETFYIVESINRKQILLSNEMTKRIALKRVRKNLPIECKIETKEGQLVNWNRPIRSQKDKSDFQELVEKLEKDGVIEESTSYWLNPIVLVRKKSNNSLRFCMDLRKLNDLVTLDNYEIPKITDLLHSLRDMKYFSLIDLKMGFLM